jgi:23S rRNA pseudouridine1911/1915/1917 synthase
VRTAVSITGTLLDALEILVPGAARRTLRQMLSQRRIRLNGEVCVNARHPVGPGDTLEIGAADVAAKLPYGLEVVFEDSDIIVAHKPVNLLTVATAGERERTAYACLRAWLKERNPCNKLFVVHRLDKFASGVLVFAKSERVQSLLKGIFKRHDIQRKYLAVVEGLVDKNQGTIQSYLAENRLMRMYSTEDKARGKLAVTHFRVLRRTRGFSSLEVTLETGRKNQIRVHLSEMGHPIVGDRAYGCVKDPLKRLGLHAFHLSFRHPVNGKPMLFQTEPPPEFVRYL